MIDLWSFNTYGVANLMALNPGKWDEILQHCHPNQFVSDYSSLNKILELQEQYGEMARDIAGRLDTNDLRHEADVIARYLSQVEGKPTTARDIISSYAQYEESTKTLEREI